jgi:hypothetical protein
MLFPTAVIKAQSMLLSQPWKVKPKAYLERAPVRIAGPEASVKF